MGLHVDVQVLLRGAYVRMAWMLSWRIGIGVTWYMCVSNSYSTVHARQELPCLSLPNIRQLDAMGKSSNPPNMCKRYLASTAKTTPGRRVTCSMQVTLFRRSRKTRTRARADRTGRAGTRRTRQQTAQIRAGKVLLGWRRVCRCDSRVAHTPLLPTRNLISL